jgi:hypothetical protein
MVACCETLLTTAYACSSVPGHDSAARQHRHMLSSQQPGFRPGFSAQRGIPALSSCLQRFLAPLHRRRVLSLKRLLPAMSQSICTRTTTLRCMRRCFPTSRMSMPMPAISPSCWPGRALKNFSFLNTLDFVLFGKSWDGATSQDFCSSHECCTPDVANHNDWTHALDRCLGHHILELDMFKRVLHEVHSHAKL